MRNKYREFYTKKYESGEYGGIREEEAEINPFYEILKESLERYKIDDASKCLEIGSGRGVYQDMVQNYIGLDYSESVGKYYHKLFVSASAEEMPFSDETFDFIWSYQVFEHIPNPEEALAESMRVLKKDGIFLLFPAWYCRPWAAEGYQVRPYSDFNLQGKLYKLIIPVLNFIPIRLVNIFAYRSFYSLYYFLSNSKKNLTTFRLPFKKIKANYEVFWQPDSDACCILDPYLVILWCRSQGYKILSHKGLIRQFFIGYEPIEIQK